MGDEDQIRITRRQFGRILNLHSGKKHEVEVKTGFAGHILEVEDAHFHLNSAVLLPDYGDQAPKEDQAADKNRNTGLAVLAACYRHARTHPGQRALVVGHTDRSGPAAYNQTLSELRASNVYYALTGDRGSWADVAEEKHKVEDYQQILRWLTFSRGWDCDPGKKDGVLGSKTRKAVAAFQEQYNDRFTDTLPVTGVVNNETWRAFFSTYMEALKELIVGEGEDLKDARHRLLFLACPSIGCGERYPITPNRKANYVSMVDRRVEVLFFDPGEEPLLDCLEPEGACVELYKQKMYQFEPIKIDPLIPPDVKYNLRVLFAGESYVPQGADYRCTFVLEEEGGKKVEAKAELSPKAYRLLFNDNHAMKGSQKGLLGSGGDARSKPANYKGNNWQRDIQPAVGIRVELRYTEDGIPVEILPEKLFVRWAMEDLGEDFAPIDGVMSPARPKAWMQKFVGAFQKEAGKAVAGADDNALKPFGGVREKGQKGKAATVLFKTPFSPNSPTSLDTVALVQARSPFVPSKDDAGKPIGVSEVVFSPPPVGGDNYRFTCSLVNAAGKTMTLDDDSTERKVGAITLWRKIMIDLIVTTNGVSKNYINWDLVKKAYRAAFVEVEEKNNIKSYNEAAWKAVCRDYFKNDVGLSDAVVNNAAAYSFASDLLPNFAGVTNSSRKASKHGKALAKKFLDKAYKDTGRKNPRTADRAQQKTPGLYMFLCKRVHQSSGLLGAYLGDREFFMVTRGDGTVTFVHEMGHALYLRHALVSFDTPNKVTNDLKNKNWLDHDQGEASICAMAYENDFFGSDGKTKRTANPIEWHFCGTCMLTLRHYDRVKMSGDPAYRTLIYTEFNPIILASAGFASIPGNKAGMRKNGQIDLKALGKAESIKNNLNSTFRKDLTSMAGGKWVSSNPALADFTTFIRVIGGFSYTFHGRLKGKNGGTGKVKVHFEIDGHKSNEVEVDITN